MVINIINKSTKDRVITCLDQGAVKSYPVAVNETIEFENYENLAEIECAGTTLFIPTIFETTNYTLVDDKEIYRARKQADIMYVLVLTLMIAVTILSIDATIVITGLFLIIEALIITGVYKIVRSEQVGEVVFIER